MRAVSSLLITAMLTLIATSGCLAGEKEETASPSATSSSAAPTTNTATTTSAPANQPPVANATVSVNGTAVSPVNGSFPIPAGKNVTFNASASSDPDGDNLTFEWEFGDGNTSANASAVYAYSTGGNYTVNLTVTDQPGETDTLTLNVTVAGGGGIVFFDDADNAQEWTFDTVSTTTTVCTGDTGFAPGWHTTDAEAMSGELSWTHQTEDIGGYMDCEISSMTSPAIDLSGASSATLTMWIRGDSELTFDYLHWEASSDGTTFEVVGQNPDEVLADWTQITADLSAYAGGTMHLRLRFESDGNCSGLTPIPDLCGDQPYAGWFVDDITVTAG